MVNQTGLVLVRKWPIVLDSAVETLGFAPLCPLRRLGGTGATRADDGIVPWRPSAVSPLGLSRGGKT